MNGRKRLYLKREELGKGAQGVCYKYIRVHDEKVIACKIIRREALDTNDRVEALKNEISILKRLQHPNICQYEHYFDDEKLAYLLMEYCP